MEYTVQHLDEMCIRLDYLAEQIAHPGYGVREDQSVSEVVQTIQRIGEGIAWAYGQQNRPELGEQFAQPFVDRRIRDRFKSLLIERKPLRREFENRIAAQILQTIHILLQATPTESTLFCSLTSGFYLNEVVSAPFDFRENEDLLPLWMTMVKDIATMLNADNLMLFFNPCSDKQFPIFSEAIRYYHHPVSQVRTHVQAMSLEIFLKLRDGNLWKEPIFDLVLHDSTVFFTHVCCLLREFWRMVDDNARAGKHRDVRSALYIQNDILMYVNDVLACEIPQLSEIVQEKLLRFAVLPVLVRSMLRPPRASRAGEPQDALAPMTAWYLLHDALTTLRSGPILAAVAFVLLRHEIPDQVLSLVLAAPPRTPTQYLTIQAGWGGHPRPGGFERGEQATDEVLYAMPQVPTIALLENRASQRQLVTNRLMDALEAMIRSFGSNSEVAGMAISVLGVATLLLRTLRKTKEALSSSSAERLSQAFCDVLTWHRQLRWPALKGALGALRELAAAVDVPLGRARLVLGRPLREKVLGPIAVDLLQGLKQQSSSGLVGLESWLHDFQEQWAADQVTQAEQGGGLRQKELLELGTVAGSNNDTPGSPEGRARCLRVLIGARRIATCLTSPGVDSLPPVEDMPGIDDAESEETTKFQPGVPVHIGKMNRLKLNVRNPRKNPESESLYMLPMKTTLVLAVPDEQKPFWAKPVVVEPLRNVRVAHGTETLGPLEQISPSGANSGEQPHRTLRLEVFSPRSPFLKGGSLRPGAPGLLGQPGHQVRPGGGPSAAFGAGDPMAGTLPTGTGAAGHYSVPSPADKIAMSVPAGAGANGGPVNVEGSTPGQQDAPTGPTPLTLTFADERRRKVACKIFIQARHAVCQHMAEGLEAFLTDIKDERIWSS